MNKALSIQQNKLFSSYGGVESMIDTIEDLSLKIEPFDKWHPLYDNVCQRRKNELLLSEPRLCSRLKSLGFDKLTGFFVPDTSLDDEPDFKDYNPSSSEKARMVQTSYFPKWFFCPKCHSFKPLEEWRNDWKIDGDFDKYAPACANCGGKKGGIKRPKIQQTRFIMVSMETGEISDIPWKKLFAKRGVSDSKNALVWIFNDNSPEANSVTYHWSSSSTNLARIYVQNEKGERVSMADVFNHYIVMEQSGKSIVFRPAVRSDNNVYYAYNLNCIYIPHYVLTQKDVDNIKKCCDNNVCDPETIKNIQNLACSVETIKDVIDNGFVVTIPSYVSEEQFRIEEYDFITDANNYLRGSYVSEDRKLISNEYEYVGNKPRFIKNIYYQTRLNVTTVQIAYSRVDKIGLDSLQYWKGKSENPKKWYRPSSDAVEEVDVALCPTCSGDIGNIEKMPALSSYGEGFFVDMDINYIPSGKRMIFMHTFCHLLMKEMEFVCGYSLASMSERLYCLEDENKYGFLIYSVGGGSGSYGGITSLFTTNNIEKIIEDAMFLAEDCSNDPICSSEGGSCFACVQIPETACELFNQDLSRVVFNKYKY